MFDRIPARSGRHSLRPRSPRGGRGVVHLRSRSSHIPKKRVRVTPTHQAGSRFGWVVMAMASCLALGVVVTAGWLGWQLVVTDHFDTGPYRVVVVGQADQTGRNPQVSLLQYVPATNQMQVITLPGVHQVPVLGGYGPYQLNAVQPLLTLEKRSPEFLTAAYSFALQVAIDQVVVVPLPETVHTKTDLETAFWRGHAWRWWRTVQRLSPESIVFLTKSDLSTLPTDLAPFTTLQTDCPVAVVNATTTSGLAAKVGRVLEQSQQVVVRVTDQAQKTDSTKVVFREDKPACAPILRGLHHVVPVTFPVDLNATMATQHRADVVIILGQDVADL